MTGLDQESEGSCRTAVLQGPRVTLRGPERRDIEAIASIGVDAEIMRFFGATLEAQAELTTTEAEAHYRELLDTELPLWVIEADGAFIGTAGFSSVNTDDRRGRFAIGILDPGYLGRGLGTEVTRLVLAYGFEVMCLHRIDVRVLSFNERAIACYRKSGFVEDGRERESALVGGEWYDDLIMSILESEYRRLRPSWPEAPYLGAAKG